VARILIVDDDPSTIELLELNFTLDGHEVLVARDGLDAQQVATERAPDAVLLDVMMPRLDGFTLCERLRALPGTATIPILFVSACAQPSDLTRGRRAGASDYVTKPFDPIGLVRRVEQLLATGHPTSAASGTTGSSPRGSSPTGTEEAAG
jgi:DNA-binding response OmpR family regulator